MTQNRFTLANGIILDTDRKWARDATRYAKRKGLDDIYVCTAEHLDGTETYLVLQNSLDQNGKPQTEPIFEHTSYEAICFHIDILYLNRFHQSQHL